MSPIRLGLGSSPATVRLGEAWGLAIAAPSSGRGSPRSVRAEPVESFQVASRGFSLGSRDSAMLDCQLPPDSAQPSVARLPRKKILGFSERLEVIRAEKLARTGPDPWLARKVRPPRGALPLMRCSLPSDSSSGSMRTPPGSSSHGSASR